MTKAAQDQKCKVKTACFTETMLSELSIQPRNSRPVPFALGMKAVKYDYNNQSESVFWGICVTMRLDWFVSYSTTHV